MKRAIAVRSGIFIFGSGILYMAAPPNYGISSDVRIQESLRVLLYCTVGILE